MVWPRFNVSLSILLLLYVALWGETGTCNGGKRTRPPGCELIPKPGHLSLLPLLITKPIYLEGARQVMHFVMSSSIPETWGRSKGKGWGSVNEEKTMTFIFFHQSFNKKRYVNNSSSHFMASKSFIKKIWKQLPLPVLSKPDFLIRTSSFSGFLSKLVLHLYYELTSGLLTCTFSYIKLVQDLWTSINKNHMYWLSSEPCCTLFQFLGRHASLEQFYEFINTELHNHMRADNRSSLCLRAVQVQHGDTWAASLLHQALVNKATTFQWSNPEKLPPCSELLLPGSCPWHCVFGLSSKLALFLKLF